MIDRCAGWAGYGPLVHCIAAVQSLAVTNRFRWEAFCMLNDFRGSVCSGMAVMKNYLFFLLLFCPLPAYASSQIHHAITITLSPQEKRLSAVDTITVPRGFPRDLQFTLQRGLTPRSPEPQVHIVKQRDQNPKTDLETYILILPRDVQTITISYEGSIYHPVDKAESVQGVSDTPGIISQEGIYLTGSTGWYPGFDTDFVSFDLDVHLPGGWDCVSQGERVRADKETTMSFVRWHSPEPQESIYLIAGAFHVYEKPGNRMQAMVFLRTPDAALAESYLDAAIGDIAMYSRLIGPYPYAKFALVENFWETGFGMPSFTLLGSTVIRLPFIISSSYPHEILHNWWGNSVYPVYDKGNWSEGLTAYLADHLFKEVEGTAADYRMATLQKYADYVSGTKDFPLSQFHSRYSHSTEAIGYGKSLMFFHMLRREMGDDVFRQGLQKLYRDFKFRFASFDDIRTSFEAVSGKRLKQEFEQWTTRIGAPRLVLGEVNMRPAGGEYLLRALLEQTQEGPAYKLLVPVAVTLEGQVHAFMTTVDMETKKAEINLRLPQRPLRLDIDPEFDLFRQLDRGEIPPALSTVLGSRKLLILLPAAAGKGLLEAYQAFGRALAGSGPDEVAIRLDTDVSSIPQDSSVMILGWENRFRDYAAASVSAYDVSIGTEMVRIREEALQRRNRSFVLLSRHPGNPDAAVAWITVDEKAALRGLARKLPHYGKYSYLVFDGAEPINIAKGQWRVAGTALTKYFPDEKGGMHQAQRGALPARTPLAAPR